MNLINHIDSGYVISALMFGLIIVIFHTLAKKSPSQIVSSALKAVIGFVIFNVGVALFLQTANNLRKLVSLSCGFELIDNTNEYFQHYGLWYGPVMILGFLVHLLIEKYLVKEDKRIVNMGGCHVLLRVSLLVTGIFTVVYGSTSWPLVIIVSSLICGAWYSLQPKLVDRCVTTVRGDSQGAYGHQTSISLLAVGSLVKLLVREKKDDTEKVKIPRWLAIARDMGFCMFTLQNLVTLIFGLMCGLDGVATVTDIEVSPLVWLLLQGVLFSAGYYTLTSGLRMITTELVPGIDWLRKKLVPEARMAMDVPSLFPFGQNAVLFGALSGSAVFILLLFVFAKLRLGFIGGATLYFYMCAGGASVYGNKIAGRKGAVIAGIVTAVFMASGSLLIQYLGGAFYGIEYFCNVASEPDDRLLLYPVVILIGRLLFGQRAIPFGK